MSDVYTALVEAGAPEMREPCFYRVLLNADDTLDIQIRRRNPRIGSRLIRRATAFRRDDETPVEALARAARRIHDEVLLYDEALDLIGDHAATTIN